MLVICDSVLLSHQGCLEGQAFFADAVKLDNLLLEVAVGDRQLSVLLDHLGQLGFLECRETRLFQKLFQVALLDSNPRPLGFLRTTKAVESEASVQDLRIFLFIAS